MHAALLLLLLRAGLRLGRLLPHGLLLLQAGVRLLLVLVLVLLLLLPLLVEVQRLVLQLHARGQAAPNAGHKALQRTTGYRAGLLVCEAQQAEGPGRGGEKKHAQRVSGRPVLLPAHLPACEQSQAAALAARQVMAGTWVAFVLPLPCSMAGTKERHRPHTHLAAACHTRLLRWAAIACLTAGLQSWWGLHRQGSLIGWCVAAVVGGPQAGRRLGASP